MWFPGFALQLMGVINELNNEENNIMNKTLHNSDVSGAKKNISDLEVFGDGDTFQLICKASSKSEGWMKSTKAMQIDNIGCVVQVTTQQGDNIAEAVTFVPGVMIQEYNDDGESFKMLIAYD